MAFPCASQNEIDHSDAVNLVNSGCRIVVEGIGEYCDSPSNMDTPALSIASKYLLHCQLPLIFTALAFLSGSNMPCTPEAVDVLRKANVIVAPSMAAGVGGVCSTFLLGFFS